MSDTPTAALVEEARAMTTDTLIEEAMGEMHRLGIDNLRAKGAIVLLVEALRRAEAECDAQHAEVLRLAGAVAVVKMRGRQIAELTATRDLLTAENARLQKERDAAAASLNALAKGARHVPCFGECASERSCIACYGLQNLKGWVEWQKRTETERDEARSELAEARAHIATLELLRRGGK